MNVLLTGATGFIGGHVATALAAAGHRVRPASRRNGIDFARMRSPEDWLPHLDGAAAAVNCAGIIGETGGQRFETLHRLAPSALFQACARAGVRRVVHVSALGADDAAWSAYHLSKRAADDCLRGLDLEWFVLRPSLVYGPGGASTALFLRLASLPRMPVIGDGRQKIQPVHVGDVADTILECLASTQTRLTLDVVGGEALDFAEWLRRLRLARGLPPAGLVRIPLSLARAGMWLGQPFHPMLRPDNLRMLQQGNTADCGPLARFLGRAPRKADARLLFARTAPTAPAGDRP